MSKINKVPGRRTIFFVALVTTFIFLGSGIAAASGSLDENIDQQQIIDTGGIYFGQDSQRQKIGQQFVPSKPHLNRIVIKPFPSTGIPQNNVVVAVFAADDKGFPSGEPLARTTISNQEWFRSMKDEPSLSLKCNLIPEKMYLIILEVDKPDDENYRWVYSSPENGKDEYGKGHVVSMEGGNWTDFWNPVKDLYFKILFSSEESENKKTKVRNITDEKVLPLFSQASENLYRGGYVYYSGDMEIVKDGTPKAVIIISENAAETDRFAALELQKYIKKISGAEIPIKSEEETYSGTRLFIGNTQAFNMTGLKNYLADKKPGALLVKRSGNDIFFAGKGSRGAIYSIFAFLEECLDVRWFMPGEDGEDYPRLSTILLGKIDISEEPGFNFRGSWDIYACNLNEERNRDLAEWNVRNKVNDPGIKIPLRLGGSAGSSSNWHNFNDIIPSEKYFDSHPEYFSLINGKRYNASGLNGQLCIANSDVIRLVVENIRENFDQHPEYDIYTLTPNDGFGWCECEKCRAWDDPEEYSNRLQDLPNQPVVSTRLLRFYNSVAEEVYKTHPDRKIQIVAYVNYSPPPKIKPYKNLMVQVQHYVPGCYSHLMEDGNCPQNKKFHELVTGWTNICKDGLGVLNYTWKTVWQQLPWPVTPIQANDLKFLNKIGVATVCLQSGSTNWGVNGLHYYIMTKMMWDPGLDVKSLLDDYYEKFFKEVKEPMKDYFETLQKAWLVYGEDYHAHITTTNAARVQQIAPKMFPMEVMGRCRKDLDEALKLAKDDIVMRRVVRVERAFHYAEMYMQVLENYEKWQITKDVSYKKKGVDLCYKILEYSRKNGDNTWTLTYKGDEAVEGTISWGYWHNLLALFEEKIKDSI